jgi:phosphatidylserine/phosphatidylglycerophosphate/cardiolipin synthase-like enzyme
VRFQQAHDQGGARVARRDDKVAIAHNKVMVIDGATVITGSFNFMQAAQQKNAENVLLITDDDDIANAHAVNWHRRAAQSSPIMISERMLQ